MTRRLLLSYLAITVLVLLGLEIPFGISYARGELARFTTGVQRDADALTELAEEDIEEHRTAALPDLIGDYARRTGGRVVVVDRSGAVLADSAGAPGATLATAGDVAAALHGGATVAQNPVGQLMVTLPAASGPTIRGALRLTIPTTAVTDRVHHIWLLLALAGLAVLAVAAALGLGMARWITRPLRTLERATTQLADGTLTDPPTADLGPPELRRLATTFTHTATRLQHLLHAQHSFAADASHQLKTPLTALRLRLENLEPDLHPRALSSLDTALAEIDRLNRLVQGLLALARLEEGATTPEHVDLDAVVVDRAAVWSAFAAEHDVDIAVSGAPAGPVWAVPGALDQIVDNLLANALRVAPPHSTIILARGRFGDRVELHVIDQGPGMTAEQRRRAFDRFWRAPDAGDDGAGLGLTIVARLVGSSGGEVALHDAPGSGLDAAVRLRSATTARHFPTPASRARTTRDRRQPAHSQPWV
jgi:signal transduction histidine kinase